MRTREKSEEPAGGSSPVPERVRRRARLAMIHIAAKELGISEEDYRTLLADRFGVSSAARLSTDEMERLLEHFSGCGWRPKGRAERRAILAARRKRKQVVALQSRAREILTRLEDSDERRLEGLCEKICGRRDLSSCRDVEKLRRLLAVLGGIRESESSAGHTVH
jgi:hypothetical protein